ncbi:MAG: tetratricopeptide repeat protein [Chloroflexi bacterium]|nr:tetratricopeptide repeat protein [Chloroflexota bacterium]
MTPRSPVTRKPWSCFAVWVPAWAKPTCCKRLATCNNSAKTMTPRDERDAALASYAQALELFRSVGDRLGEANVLKAIGDVQQFRKDNDAALASYAQALELFRSVGDRLGEANVQLAFGSIRRGERNLGEARKHFDLAIKAYCDIGDGYSQARVLYRLGDCFADEEKWQDAIQSYRQAEHIWKSIGLDELVAQILSPRIEQAQKHLGG